MVHVYVVRGVRGMHTQYCRGYERSLIDNKCAFHVRTNSNIKSATKHTSTCILHNMDQLYMYMPAPLHVYSLYMYIDSTCTIYM